MSAGIIGFIVGIIVGSIFGMVLTALFAANNDTNYKNQRELAYQNHVDFDFMKVKRAHILCFTCKYVDNECYEPPCNHCNAENSGYLPMGDGSHGDKSRPDK